MTEERYKAIVEEVIRILPNWQQAAVAGFWQTVTRKQWEALQLIPEFDKDLVENITKIKLL